MCKERDISSIDNAPAEKVDWNWLSRVFQSSYAEYLLHQNSENLCRASTDLQKIFKAEPLGNIAKALKDFENNDPIEELWKAACEKSAIHPAVTPQPV